MDKKFLSSLNHDLSYRPGVIMEALENGVEFGSKEFFVYAQLRWYETDGKFGFCVAGEERLGEDVGLSRQEVEDALNRLKKKGLIEHVWCDKKVYRNKTKIWVSMVRLSGVCTNVDAIKVLKDGKKNLGMLGKTTCGNVETTCENVVASPVTTGVGNTNRNTNRNNVGFSNASADASASEKSTPSAASAPTSSNEEDSSPFDENIIFDVRTKSNADSANANKKAGKVVVEMCKVLGRDARGQGVSVANAKKLFAKGYTYEELIGLAEWAKKSEFYKEKPLHTILGNDAMQQYQVEKNKTTEKGIVKGFNL